MKTITTVNRYDLKMIDDKQHDQEQLAGGYNIE